MNKPAQDLARKIAKQLANEPLEILKTAKEQVSGSENSPSAPTGQTKSNFTEVPKDNIADKLKAARRIEALTRELADIRKQDTFIILQKRIAEGVEVPVEDYPELSLEQRQVLKAQKEAYANRKRMEVQSGASVVEPQAKKGRRLFNFGKKTSMKREQTRVEKVNPPSG